MLLKVKIVVTLWGSYWKETQVGGDLKILSVKITVVSVFWPGSKLAERAVLETEKCCIMKYYEGKLNC